MQVQVLLPAPIKSTHNRLLWVLFLCFVLLKCTKIWRSIDNNSKYIKNTYQINTCKIQIYMLYSYMRDCDRYAMKREVAARIAGFSVEYVRFKTGRKNIF